MTRDVSRPTNHYQPDDDSTVADARLHDVAATIRHKNRQQTADQDHAERMGHGPRLGEQRCRERGHGEPPGHRLAPEQPDGQCHEADGGKDRNRRVRVGRVDWQDAI